MRHGSLFTGIGGFDLAAEWMGWENVFQVEWDGFCQKVLAKNFPNVKRYGDIKEFDGTKYRGLIDIISGGPPCQPISIAGKQKGEADDRWLWEENNRIVREVKPAYFVFENPPAITSMAKGKPFERILSTLENEGFEIELLNIPAGGIGAWHKRERIWIIAKNSNNIRCNSSKREVITNNGKLREFSAGNIRRIYTEQISSNSNGKRGCSGKARGKYAEDVRQFSGNTECGHWDIEPKLGRVANGISNRVDRLKGLGNAIVPQIAFQLFKAIVDYENM